MSLSNDTSYETLLLDIKDNIVVVTFNRDKDTNSFSRAMTLELMGICHQLIKDGESDEPKYGALVLTGGAGRSFSVGGDFCDVSQLDEEGAIREYLGEIIDLYLSILKINIPVIAAIDNFAIGQGLQVALMTDWRMGTDNCRLQMPELKNGVACPLGSIILEFLFGRAKMLEFVLDCEFIDAETSRNHCLLNQVVSAEELQLSAFSLAQKYAAYPRSSFTTTKRIQNQRFIDAMESVREDSSKAHVAAFLKKEAKQHFDKILGRD